MSCAAGSEPARHEGGSEAPPRVRVLAVHAGRVLLGRRAGGTWGLPGGAVDGGEALAHAAARELREETGVAVGAGDVAAMGPVSGGGGGAAVFFVASLGGRAPPTLDPSNDPDGEFDELEFMPLRAAAGRRDVFPDALAAIRTLLLRDAVALPPRLVPCAGDDCFSYRTIHARQPAIVESLLAGARPPYDARACAALRALAADCAGGAPLRPLPEASATWGAPHAAKHAAATWASTDIWCAAAAAMGRRCVPCCAVLYGCVWHIGRTYIVVSCGHCCWLWSPVRQVSRARVLSVHPGRRGVRAGARGPVRGAQARGAGGRGGGASRRACTRGVGRVSGPRFT